MKAYKDFNNRTCLEVQRGRKYVHYILMESRHLKIRRAIPATFDATFAPMEDYPVDTAVAHFARAAKRLGASAEALTALGLHHG